MIDFLIGLAAIGGTVSIYLVLRLLHIKWGYTFTMPAITGTIVIVVILLIFNIPYETYMIGGDWINQLLGPAVVALAYPLYRHYETLKKLTVPILSGTSVGAVVGVSTGVLLAKWAGFEEEIIYSLTPKNATTPVAMDISGTLEGSESLAAIFVMIAGIGGVFVSSFVFKYCGITHYLGRGVGLGSASHGIGTASAIERSHLEGSVSTIAMVVSAVTVSIIAPWLVMLLM
ncbi:putative murein hydrolase (TIGR00659 family) [Virgibacillus natechei]|uniref:Murein hydrolase (TIGR00659 family) n=1 Tax=Virgibacillus natechei TaxID=1216297 RepID=A0ABS4IH08_9BACI|nr:LrgB family protein [Virgibacillus natechei]MBP1970227.1 putative murein hydrolase (TIGR00659 family) [Virgibacillus natechei]UZD12825.1 LrgB family protein [Virgibacillus natechei]